MSNDASKEPFRVPVRLFELGTVVATPGALARRRTNSGSNVWGGISQAIGALSAPRTARRILKRCLRISGFVGLSCRSGQTQQGGASLSASRSDSDFGIGDLYPTGSLSWNRGVNNVMTYLTGDVPVGLYNSQNLANLGIGHGSIVSDVLIPPSFSGCERADSDL